MNEDQTTPDQEQAPQTDNTQVNPAPQPTEAEQAKADKKAQADADKAAKKAANEEAKRVKAEAKAQAEADKAAKKAEKEAAKAKPAPVAKDERNGIARPQAGVTKKCGTKPTSCRKLLVVRSSAQC